MLTCLAIVLDICPFTNHPGKAPGRPRVLPRTWPSPDKRRAGRGSGGWAFARRDRRGVGAPGSCAARDSRDGMLPTIINAEGTWGRRDAGWSVVAKCQNAAGTQTLRAAPPTSWWPRPD